MRNQRISARRKEISLSSISCRRSSRGHERYPVALKQPRVRRISIGNVSCWLQTLKATASSQGLVLPAPQFPSGLANAVEDMAPKKNIVLRVLPAPAF